MIVIVHVAPSAVALRAIGLGESLGVGEYAGHFPTSPTSTLHQWSVLQKNQTCCGAPALVIQTLSVMTQAQRIATHVHLKMRSTI
jgi:hypothetical protein